MARKFMLILIFSLLAGGGIFADEDSSFPRNTISIDTVGLYMFLSTAPFGEDFIFSTALQYEYQILKNFSVATRSEYKLLRWGTDMSSISIEGHARFYPAADTFFLDGMLGYTNFLMTDMPVSHHFKFGGRVGWRIDFGTPGGFIIEPSLGYSGSIGKTNIDFNGKDAFMNLVYDFIARSYFVGGFVFSFGIGYRF